MCCVYVWGRRGEGKGRKERLRDEMKEEKRVESRVKNKRGGGRRRRKGKSVRREFEKDTKKDHCFQNLTLKFLHLIAKKMKSNLTYQFSKVGDVQ